MSRPKRGINQRGRLKININSKPRMDVVNRPGINWLQLTGMTWGIAYIQNSFQAYRCVRWRRYGICRYILIGKDRGKIVPVMRNFRKLKECTKEDEQKIHRWIKRYEMYGI